MNSSRVRRTALAGFMLLLACPFLQAAGTKDQIQTVTAEGGEIWQNTFDVSGKHTGKYNYIINAEDRAGNTAVDGPYNVFVNPKAGLPVTTVIFPREGDILRQDIRLVGVASGRFGVETVQYRLDNTEAVVVDGTEYWSKLIDTSEMPEGKHTVYTEAFDSKGMSGGASKISFILDKTPPSLELESHAVGDIISGNVTIKGISTDANGIASLSISNDGGENYKPLKTLPVRDGRRFHFDIKTKTLEDGPVVYHIKSVDTTGLVTVKPFLFFVDNMGPEIEILTPTVEDDVYGKFLLSGQATDTIGLARVYYEWGGKPVDIELRPGDPFWNVELEKKSKGASTIKVTAIDRSGNKAVATRKLEDRRSNKKPVLIIDYPPPDIMNSMPSDDYIYGHIENGIAPASVTVSGGIGLIEALPGFRIPLDSFKTGHNTIRIVPKAADNTTGKAVSLKIKKMPPLGGVSVDSPVTVTSPEKNAWVSGSSFILQGTVTEANFLEYRIGPEDVWKPITLNRTGVFNAEIGIAGYPEGILHFELRTVRSGLGDEPVYHPLNNAAPSQEFRFIAPTPEGMVINSNSSVMAEITTLTPIQTIEYTYDGHNFDDIPFISKYGKTWFSQFADFISLAASGHKLGIRVTDASGAYFDYSPDFVFNGEGNLPIVMVNTPTADEVITGPFNVSGVAFDNVAVAAVNWRILGPKPESIPPGPAGDEARAAAVKWAANPDVPFQRFETVLNFSIPVEYPVVIDGEYDVEVYAEDIYGVKGEVTVRTIKVSSMSPISRILDPVISRYNSGAIMVKGVSDDANGIKKVSLSLDAGNTWQRATVLEEGNWQIPLNTTMYNDGILAVYINAEDNYGETSLVIAMLNVDNTPPELAIGSPANNQHIGTDFELVGRVQDNIELQSLTFQIISAVNPNYRRSFEIPPQLVIFESMSLAGFPQGEYIIRIAAKDLADNESIVSRKVVYDADDRAAQIAIFNPLPGEIHTGPVKFSGAITGSFIPGEVALNINDESVMVEVDRWGLFQYSMPNENLLENSNLVLSAAYRSENGKPVNSPRHTLHYSRYGPSLVIDSHEDGDYITKRPWLSGRAWMEGAPGEIVDDDGNPVDVILRSSKPAMTLKQVLVSYDNGRSFTEAAVSGSHWKFRLETSTLPQGPQPVLVKAVFGSGHTAVRRVLLVVDTVVPQITTLAPPERSVHRDDLLIYGIASDNFTLSTVDISLRPNDKFWYSVPGPIRGMYFDVKTFGATYFDVGMGITFFKDNVRFQGQFGLSPAMGIESDFATGGRFVGNVWGFKMLANILYLPFSYLFGLDWEFYSMRIALGANFSYFQMDERREPAWIGAVVGQWEFANIDMQYFYPNWKYFHNFSLYLEPEFWFISSDIEAATVPRLTIGLRWNFF